MSAANKSRSNDVVIHAPLSVSSDENHVSWLDNGESLKSYKYELRFAWPPISKTEVSSSIKSRFNESDMGKALNAPFDVERSDNINMINNELSNTSKDSMAHAEVPENRSESSRIRSISLPSPKRSRTKSNATSSTSSSSKLREYAKSASGNEMHNNSNNCNNNNKNNSNNNDIDVSIPQIELPSASPPTVENYLLYGHADEYGIVHWKMQRDRIYTFKISSSSNTKKRKKKPIIMIIRIRIHLLHPKPKENIFIHHYLKWINLLITITMT